MRRTSYLSLAACALLLDGIEHVDAEAATDLNEIPGQTWIKNACGIDLED